MLEDILSRIGQMYEHAGVKSVFGDPVQVNGHTIIPVANIRYGFGMGMGRGTEKAAGEGPLPASGEGGGGGGGVSARPVGILEISEHEIKMKPVVDVTRIALAAMALIAWNVFWVTYTVRRTSGRR